MAEITHLQRGRPVGRQGTSKYDFFHTLAVGGVATVSTAAMSEQESWRTLRSLRSIATYHRRAHGRQFRAAFSGDGIQVERLA